MCRALHVSVVLAADTALGILFKHADYIQTSAGPATLNTSTPYGFETDVLETSTAPDTVTGGSITGPTLPVTTLAFKPAGLNWQYKNNAFTSAAQLDTVYPSGAYPLTIDTLHDGNHTLALSLSADAFPAGPHITNFATLQSINAAAPVSITWDPMSNGAASDFELVQVVNAGGVDVFQSGYPGASGALNGLASGVTIPGGTLQPGTSYQFQFLFGKVQSSDSSYTGVPVLSMDAAESFFVAQTLPAPEPGSLCLLTLAGSALLLRRGK